MTQSRQFSRLFLKCDEWFDLHNSFVYNDSIVSIDDVNFGENDDEDAVWVDLCFMIQENEWWKSVWQWNEWILVLSLWSIANPVLRNTVHFLNSCKCTLQAITSVRNLLILRIFGIHRAVGLWSQILANNTLANVNEASRRSWIFCYQNNPDFKNSQNFAEFALIWRKSWISPARASQKSIKCCSNGRGTLLRSFWGGWSSSDSLNQSSVNLQNFYRICRIS